MAMGLNSGDTKFLEEFQNKNKKEKIVVVENNKKGPIVESFNNTDYLSLIHI